VIQFASVRATAADGRARKFLPPGANGGNARLANEGRATRWKESKFLSSAETAIEDWVRRRLENFEVVPCGNWCNAIPLRNTAPAAEPKRELSQV